MKSIRAKFEEIWPVPEGLFWDDEKCHYWTPLYPLCDILFEWNHRLDTFIRCQEMMAPVMSLVDELVQEIESFHADLRSENWYVPRQSALLDRAKQLMEQNK